jgi:hypothetical protein
MKSLPKVAVEMEASLIHFPGRLFRRASCKGYGSATGHCPREHKRSQRPLCMKFIDHPITSDLASAAGPWTFQVTPAQTFCAVALFDATSGGPKIAPELLKKTGGAGIE